MKLKIWRTSLCSPRSKVGEVRDLSKFKPSPYLHVGWLCSEFTNGNHINIVSLEGQRYKSYKRAAAFMKADEKYTAQDIKKLFSYPDGLKTLIQNILNA